MWFNLIQFTRFAYDYVHNSSECISLDSSLSAGTILMFFFAIPVGLIVKSVGGTAILFFFSYAKANVLTR